MGVGTGALEVVVPVAAPEGRDRRWQRLVDRRAGEEGPRLEEGQQHGAHPHTDGTQHDDHGAPPAGSARVRWLGGWVGHGQSLHRVT